MYINIGITNIVQLMLSDEKIQEICFTCDISINDELLVTTVNPMRKRYSYKNGPYPQ